MHPTAMAEKSMFPTCGSKPIRGRAGCGESRTSGSVGGMAQTSRSSPAIGGAVPTQSRIWGAGHCRYPIAKCLFVHGTTISEEG